MTAAAAGAGRAPAAEELFTGESGSPGRRRRRLLMAAADRLMDARLRLSAAKLDELASAAPRREVLAVSAYRGDGGFLPAAIDELRCTRHSLRVALGAMDEPSAALREETVAAGLAGGKFENLNAVLAAAGADPDWTLVVDDDVALPPRFLDRFLGVCERLDLTLAQPAQTLRSFAAWRVTRRRAGSLARETRFVEIGPVTAFARPAAAELLPFEPLRYGWGLDLHWAAIAAERGWRLGVVDAVPVRHEHAAVAASYSSDEAIEEARRFLAGRPFVDSTTALQTVRTHPLSTALR